MTRCGQGDSVEVMGAAGASVGPVAFATGDGTVYRVVMTVTDYSASTADEYVYGHAKIMHAYPSETDTNWGNKARKKGMPWVAVLRGCCRQGDSSEFSITTYVDMAVSPESLGFRAPPVIAVPEGAVTVVTLPANTARGEGGRYWRFAQGRELGPQGIGRLNPDPNRVYWKAADYLEGKLTINTTCAAATSASAATGVPLAGGGEGAGGAGGCELRAGSNVVVGVMVAPMDGRSFVPMEFRLKVVSQEQWSNRPLLYGPAADASTFRGVAGYEMFLTFFAKSNRTGSCLQAVRAFNLPEGAQVVPGLASSDTTCALNRSLDLRWTPSATDVGSHTVCYDAVDDTRMQSQYQCVELVVTTPADAGPVFTWPPQGHTVQFYMRQEKNLTLTAESSNPYDVMAIEAVDPAQLEQLGMTLSDTQDVMGRVRATDAATAAKVQAILRWWPHISHGGLDQSVCFKLVTYQDPGRAAIPDQHRCLTVRVARCKYVAAPGDDIKKIAAVFKVDWLTLWGLNSNLGSLETPPGKEINIGRSYQVLDGDTMLSIATELGMSVSDIRRLNFDLTQPRAATALNPSSSICIFPNTCP